jgi:hypothetical protein
VIGLEGGDLHHNGTHWRSLLISRKDRVPNRNMRTIRRLCAAGSADSILTGSRYLTRNFADLTGQWYRSVGTELGWSTPLATTR